MRISLIVIGKTSAPWLRQGIDEYVKRLSRYAPFQYAELPDAKLRTSKPTPDQLKQAEAPILLKALDGADHVVLLDEHGKQPRSIELAQWMEVRTTGAYGTSHWSLEEPTDLPLKSKQRPTKSWRSAH